MEYRGSCHCGRVRFSFRCAVRSRCRWSGSTGSRFRWWAR